MELRSTTNTPVWVGHRIKEAREASGLTQAELARRLGLTQTAVSYWEAGKRAPGLDDLVGLTEVLHRDPGFFFPDVPSRSQVRALLRATAQQLEHPDLEAALQRLLDEAEALQPPQRRIDVKSTRPQRAAREVLEQAGVKGPPVDVDAVTTLCGARVLYEKFDDALSGLLIALDGWAVVGVNEAHAAARQRFTIGHELGHYVLGHHDRFHIDLGPDAAYGHPPGYDWQSERAANLFAADLLMPGDFLMEALEKSQSTPGLAHQFGVSELAMGYRLLNLGLR